MSGFLLCIVFLLVGCTMSWDCDVSMKTVGKLMPPRRGKMAGGNPMEEQITKNEALCALACEFNPKCMSANALMLTDKQVTCQSFHRSYEVDELLDNDNATHLRPEVKLPPTNADEIGCPNGIKLKLPYDNLRAGGGWVLIQRRMDGSVNFYRDWQNYKEGFGSLSGEFWIGLDKIHNMVQAGWQTLRFDFWDDTASYYAEYRGVVIGSEADKYRINWVTFAGNVGDSMEFSKGMPFVTMDTSSIASKYKGGWWYNQYHRMNPNGLYGSIEYGKGTIWYDAKGWYYPFPNFEIKMKRTS